MTAEGPHRRTFTWATAVFIAAFGFRYLSLGSFENDHFVNLARAHQLFFGDLPVRDFEDPGLFLSYFASAGAAAALGRNLFAEAVLTAGALAAAAAMTYILAAEAAGSVAVALLAAAVQVVALPRLYNYPKILVYAVAVWAMWRFADHRNAARLATLAAVTAAGFLFRHDHGLFIGVAALALVVSVTARGGSAAVARAIGVYCGITAVLLLPWAVFIQRTLGMDAYVRGAISFSRIEATRTRDAWPSGMFTRKQDLFTRDGTITREGRAIKVRWTREVNDQMRSELEQRFRLAKPELDEDRTWRYTLRDVSESNVAAIVRDSRVQDTQGINRALILAPRDESGIRGLLVTGLYYLLLAAPLAAVGLVLYDRRRGVSGVPTFANATPKILSLALLLAEVDAGFLRDQLAARLPDVFGPAPVLGAWLLGRALAGAARTDAPPSHRPRVRVSSIAAIGVTAAVVAGVAALGNPVRELFETRVFTGPAGLARHVRTLTAELREWPWAKQHPNPEFLPLVLYVNDCTVPSDRVLVAWFAPETYLFARRGFAAGHVTFLFGYYGGVDEQRRAVERLSRQHVPLVLIRSAEVPGFASSWPIIDAYLARRYQRAGVFVTSGGTRIDVFAETGRPRARSYGPSGLPCYR